MAIFKRILIIGLVTVAFSPFITCAQAQNEKEIIPKDVVHCETLDDVNKAKQDGVLFFEFRNSFWARIGEDYKGPFRYLRSAQKIANQAKLDAMKKTGSTTESAAKPVKSASEATPKPTSYYNPQLIIFPFVEYMPNRQVLFSIPGGLTVSASHVMIHPEPLVFENIAYGLIDLSLFTKKNFLDAQPGAPTKPSAIPPQGTALLPASGKPFDKYFTVTGNLAARENVVMPSAPLTYWVGAAVVGKDGAVLWRQYGVVEEDNTFKCVGRAPETDIQPEFLLLFSLAKGKLETNIRPKPEFPVLDAKPYDYHIFCSSTLDMGPNWYPPMQAATKEEYEKMLDEMQRKKLEKIRGGKSKETSEK